VSDTHLCSSAILILSLTTPHLPHLPVLCLFIGISPVRQQGLYDHLAHTEISVVRLQPLQRCKPKAPIRQIGYRSAVALSSWIVQITADLPISNVRYQYRSGTNITRYLLIKEDHWFYSYTIHRRGLATKGREELLNLPAQSPSHTKLCLCWSRLHLESDVYEWNLKQFVLNWYSKQGRR